MKDLCSINIIDTCAHYDDTNVFTWAKSVMKFVTLLDVELSTIQKNLIIKNFYDIIRLDVELSTIQKNLIIKNFYDIIRR